MLGLYNAASLLNHGEEVLEEALLFARRHLESIRRGGLHDSPLSEQVGRSLKIPLPRTLKRLEAVSYIPEYSSADDDTTYNHPEILELARLDFNLLQHVHQNELRTVTQ